MPKYVVEREVPGVGASTSERSQISALNLSGTINELGGRFLTQFRMEMNDAVARLRTAQAADLDNATRTLRSEIVAARTNATTDAVRISGERFRTTTTTTNPGAVAVNPGLGGITHR
jgi:hypothetical protein